MILTPFQNTSAYTLGRFLGLAQMARDPKIWQLSDEQIVEKMLQIASEYEAEQKAGGQ